MSISPTSQAHFWPRLVAYPQKWCSASTLPAPLWWTSAFVTLRKRHGAILSQEAQFARGVHAVMAHRIAHHLWQEGDHTRALAIKSRLGRAFSTDIHPAARIGAGFWLDHGLGFVAGETCVIGQDVSIWHNVTLGSTLSDSGPQRHPVIGDGAVIGAGAIILGNVTVGAGANVAAGALVVTDVAPGTVVVGAKARQVGTAKVSFREPQE